MMILPSKVQNSQQEMPEKFTNGQDAFLFQATGSGKLESFGLWMSDNKVVKKRDKTKHWALESITFYKDSNTSLCWSQAKLIFLNELNHGLSKPN